MDVCHQKQFYAFLYMCHCSGATKGALDMLTKVMALELGPHQVASLLNHFSIQSPSQVAV